MKAQTAALEIIDFKINEIQFNYIAPTSLDDEDITNLPVDIHFDFLQGAGKNGFSIDLMISSNFRLKEPVPGYSYQVRALAEFFFNEDKFSTCNKSFTIFQNGLEIAIGHVRGYLATVSAFSPVGTYYLPALDLIKIFEQKFNDLQKSYPQMKVVKK